MDHRKRLKIAMVLRRMHSMVYGSADRRATALSQLREREGNDPFRILIGTILSQRTRDENTTKAVENLFSRFKTAYDLASANEDEVKALIRPAGFYNVKARSVIRVAKQIVEGFGGQVPRSMDELLSLHSVGRKTANCVLVYGFNTPAIPVDTHVHRIANRLGLVHTTKPEQTEQELVKTVPRRYWLDVNDLFVRFGQTTCKPIGPKCSICTLTGACEYYRAVVLPKQRGERGVETKISSGRTGSRRAIFRRGQSKGRGAGYRKGIRKYKG
jgi:endonuclease-3